MCGCFVCVFFFKQKTAYEMRISDWSSDVCSSDLIFWSIIAPARPGWRTRSASRCVNWSVTRRKPFGNGDAAGSVKYPVLDQPPNLRRAQAQEFAENVVVVLPDRKSTRLNSSH